MPLINKEQQQNIREYFRVRPEFLPVKVAFSLLYSMIACILPYMPAIMSNYGITPGEIAVIFGTTPVVSLISRPIFGYIADRFLLHRGVMLISCVVVILMYMMMWGVPLIVGSSDQFIDESIVCNGSHARNNNFVVNYSVIDNIDSSMLNHHYNCSQANAESSSEQSNEKQHFGWLLIVVMIIYSPIHAANSAFLTLYDAISFAIVHNLKGHWVHERRYGTLWFGIVCALTGFFIDIVSSKSQDDKVVYNYSPCFIQSVIFGVLFIMVTVCFLKIPELPKNANLISGFCKVIRKFQVITFFFVILCMGCAFGCLVTYSSVYFLTGRQMPASTVGIYMILCAVSEILALTLIPRLHKKIGLPYSMCLATTFYSLSFLTLGIFTNPYLLTGSGIINGFTFGLLYPTATVYAQAIAPPGTIATMQGIIGALFFSIGRGFGGFFGGILYDIYGPQFLFKSFSVFSLIVAIIYFISNLVYDRCFDSAQDGEMRGEKVATTDSISSEDFEEGVARTNDNYLLAASEEESSNDQRLVSSDCLLREPSNLQFQRLNSFSLNSLSKHDDGEVESYDKFESSLKKHMEKLRDLPADQLTIRYPYEANWFPSTEYIFCPERRTIQNVTETI